MNVTGATGAYSPNTDPALPCQRANRAIVTVTVHDLSTNAVLPEVEVTMGSGRATTDERGCAHFIATGVGGAEGATLSAEHEGATAEKALTLHADDVLSEVLTVGLPTVEIVSDDPVLVDDPTLRKAYDFLMSYVGTPNVYDSFKKVDHKFRTSPDGPVAEVPAVLACTAFDNREPAEVTKLKNALFAMVTRLCNPPPLPARLRQPFHVVVTPTWVRGTIELSVDPGAASCEVHDGTGPLPLPHSFTYGEGGAALEVVRVDAGDAVLVAKLLDAEGVTGPSPLAEDDLELKLGPPDYDDVEEAWLAFKRAAPEYDAFREAVGPDRDAIVLLARIASLYWYSDTGDVLMNAKLRGGDLVAKLKERVTYLKEYYKPKRGPADPATQRVIDALPDDPAIARDGALYGRQIQAQADMLSDTLASDLLRTPANDLKLYRGMALDAGTNPEAIFQLNVRVDLRGFSSSAEDPPVAYRFMKDSASDKNVLKRESLHLVSDPGSEEAKRFEREKSAEIERIEKRIQRATESVEKETQTLEELGRVDKSELRRLDDELMEKLRSDTSVSESDRAEYDSHHQREHASKEQQASLRRSKAEDELRSLDETLRAVRNSEHQPAFPPDQAAVPIFYRIQVGAALGRYLGAYSLHHGESEVLFPDGVFPTARKLSRLRVLEVEETVGFGRFAATKQVKRATFVGSDDEETGDAGFKTAQTELGKDMNTQELRSTPAGAAKYEAAMQAGSSLGLEWPHGDGIILVSAEMS
ncbi:MAG: hypothetical protein H6719_25405 [Sandaracinaceae bacterium]|nr:hypothetical protein [Sandaracinaceae bacterium]